MTTPSLEEYGVLREWTPMSRLLQNVPHRSRRGLLIETVRFNCVAADIHCVALGTSTGDIFWYNRSNHVVHHLKAEKHGSPVTTICVVSTVDFMLAVGDSAGVVTIFRIPREAPIDWTSPNSPKYKKEQIERFTVNELHSGRVSALCWSSNGQKLFSGDESGTIVFTEVDYALNITKATKISNEKFNIVQLCYNQREQLLLVSSEYRSVLYKNQSSKWIPSQVGQRDRPSLQPLGACFYVDENQHELFVYCCRSGLRLWKADSLGSVKFTVQFKKLVEKSNNHVKLLRPPSRNLEGPVEFGRIHYWRDGLFVSHSLHNVIVFDPVAVSVVAVLLRVDDVIASLSVTECELFVVYGDRELVRLSYSPDAYDSSLGGIGSIAAGEPVSALPDFSLNPIDGSPIVLPPRVYDSTRIKLSATTANTEPRANQVNYGTDSSIILPPIVALTEGVCELRVDCSRQYEFSSISQEKFDEIIYSKRIKRKKGKQEYITPNAGPSNPAGPCPFENSSPTLPTQVSSSNTSDLEKNSISIEAIVEEFRKNENLDLMDSVDASTKDKSKYFNKSNGRSTDGAGFSLNRVSHDDAILPVSGPLHTHSVPDHDPSTEDNCAGLPVDASLESIDLETSMISIDAIIEEFRKTEILVNSDFEYTPSDNPKDSYIDSGTITEREEIKPEVTPSSPNSKTHENLDQPTDETTASVQPRPVSIHGMVNGWNELSVPGKISWLVTCCDQVVVCTNHCHVYAANDTVWERLPFKASFMAFSSCGNHAVRIYRSVAYYSSDWRSDTWESLLSNVDWALVTEGKIWLVSLGDIYYKSYRNGNILKFPCEFSAKKLYKSDHGLLAVTTDGGLHIFDSIEWSLRRVSHNIIKFLGFGPNRLFWMVDSYNRLFLAEKLDKENWWEAVLPVNELRDIVSLSVSRSIVYTVFSVTPVSSIIAFNKVSALGVRWEPWRVFSEAVLISCEGVFEEGGIVWILSKGNQLFCCPPELVAPVALKAPCNIVCIASTSTVFWALSDDGDIYARINLSYERPTGTEWKKLNLEQFGDDVRLVHISCSCDVVWACDSRGRVYLSASPPHDFATQMFSSAWIEVDGSTLPESVCLVKVYVGPESRMVWALDATGNVYVREAVYPNAITGAGWFKVQGINAHHLALSTDSVWALSSDAIYKRSGISESDFIGDSWTRIGPPLPAETLLYMSISFNEKVWLLQKDIVYKLEERLFAISDDVVIEKDWSLL